MSTLLALQVSSRSLDRDRLSLGKGEIGLAVEQLVQHVFLLRAEQRETVPTSPASARAPLPSAVSAWAARGISNEIRRRRPIGRICVLPDTRLAQSWIWCPRPASKSNFNSLNFHSNLAAELINTNSKTNKVSSEQESSLLSSGESHCSTHLERLVDLWTEFYPQLDTLARESLSAAGSDLFSLSPANSASQRWHGRAREATKSGCCLYRQGKPANESA